MSLRSMQSNMLSFGLVNIPVRVYSANETGAKISFNQLHAEKKTRLKQQMYDPETGEVVPKDKIIKGYEFAKDQYIVFTEDEMKAIEPDADKRMSITEFVPAESVDPLYLDTIYFLGPDKGTERSFRLFTIALKETKRVAIVRYAARGREHLALIRPLGDGLALQQLRYSDEVRSPDEVPNPFTEVSDAEVALAKQLIEAQAVAAFNPTKYKDEHQTKLRNIIDQKIKGEPVAFAEAPKPLVPVIDLMAALKASLASAAVKPVEPVVATAVEPVAAPEPVKKPKKAKVAKAG